MFKRLMIKNLVLLSLLAAITACGQNEDSLPYKAPQGSRPVPDGLMPRAEFFAKNTTNATTSSSRAIRKETIGLNLDINYKDKNRQKASMMITLSYSQAAETCSQAVYKAQDVDTKDFAQPRKAIEFDDFGTARCLELENGKCKYLFLTIEKTPSSLVNVKSGLIPAAVFVVMENKSSSPLVDKFIPMISENDKLLQVPQSEKDFQYCLKPETLFVENYMDVLYVVDPLSGLDLNQYNIRNDFDFSNGFF